MSRTKIESHLTAEQLIEFLDRCAQTKGSRRLAGIQALAEEFGITISLMAASSFRDGPLDAYLEELKSKREMAEQVTAIAKSGLSLSDAASSVLSQKIFDQALKLDADGDDALENSNMMSLAISRLRTGDQRAPLVAARLKEYERREIEWDEQRRKIAAVSDKVRNAPAMSADELRAKVVEELDAIMGITK